ncbi:uncharacterized protein (UPF0548 family) [Prosthecobacter fusiformis]|uniref:Uncharacterized protein (UPF0548 family) n=1 Tax=Prosthecobacter fusiformis TaxID=48464 RepID=A0A4R7RYN6_9BACT|nr:DUF1990 domain-containing protein [Prosthecobacter fusiformis]TDU71040.1 uncharacterized protein (UPF0548 family) [Prosthecobacter fusiformis]
MISLKPPSSSQVMECVRACQDAPLSYAHRQGVEQPPVEGFIEEEHRVCLGVGTTIYHRARRALDAWKMFPAWTVVYPFQSAQQPGQVVAMVVRICGMSWINPCRILSRCDDETHHGFVYGTLPEHAECGEERFRVEKRPDGSVWYEIRAFSRPHHWLAWIGFPLARWWQLRFVRDSQEAMKKAVSS